METVRVTYQLKENKIYVTHLVQAQLQLTAANNSLISLLRFVLKLIICFECY